MEIRDLEFLTRLMEFGSMTRAARHLRVDASTLSRHISGLEDELGALLFERGTGGIRSTVAGRNVGRLARRVIADLDSIRRVATEASRATLGELRLATQLANLGPRLRPAIAIWRSDHPRATLELFEADEAEAFTRIRERRADVALMHSEGTTEMSCIKLWEEDLILAVPVAHLLAAEENISWSHIRAETIFIRQAFVGNDPDSTHVRLLGAGLDLRIQRSGPIDLLNMVSIGEGVALVCGSHREISFPGVRYLDINEPDARIAVTLVWRSDLEDPVVGSFVAFMRDWSRSVGAG